MAKIPCFNATQMEAACKVLGDTERGLKGDEIGYILATIGVPDPDAGITKWKRLYNALAHAQNEHHVGNHLILFINEALSPARYISTPELFEWRSDGLNVALAFAGYAVNKDGKVIHSKVSARRSHL
ncbi:MAG: hypothetical protein CVU32_02530 [Betaproteobacteria bacterium HGW-Betaproteobacteria-5]|jgi:hypothetical protein|nr:MAG: hypothetical protein CVU32_02530 [Betaproteobacteria bacterium HGW-Betaproteobacteria-5]PKO38566.1 MAG: hypothetical protein CVU33_08110 [Betaproteobacteria bacterium HGW-Betaproteobacteria-6]